jgi:hypothetical protein
MAKSNRTDKAVLKFRIKERRDQRLAGAARLPKSLRQAARAILGRDPHGEQIADHADREDARMAGARMLDDLAPRARLRVFETLMPRLARYVEAAWQLGTRLPYQAGAEGRLFRAPHTPAVSRKMRSDWLAGLIDLMNGHDRSISWLALRAEQVDGYGEADVLGVLFAAVIDGGGKEGNQVFACLGDLARAGQEKGMVRPHVARALLAASRPDGWELIQEMLLDPALGSDQHLVLLESAGFAHPEAFQRLLRLILERGLGRLDAVVQTLDAWLGYAWGAVSQRVINRVLEQVVRFLEDAKARTSALRSEDAETVYLALWAMAFDDAVAVVKPATRLLKDDNVERRFVAAHLLGQLDLPVARSRLRGALGDSDLRVALRALEGLTSDLEGEPGHGGRAREDVFESIERLLRRLPARRQHLEPIVWPWEVLTADVQQVAADLIGNLGPRPAARLLPYLRVVDVDRHAPVAERAGGMRNHRRTR